MAIAAVAMSGGVDSSAAAWRLLQAGYKVFGITMLLWDKEMTVEKEGGGEDPAPIIIPKITGRTERQDEKEDLAPRVLATQEAGHLVLPENAMAATAAAAGRSGVWPALQRARQVAEQLGFPHYTLDLRPAFQEQVVQYFVREYLRGRTPNPCVVCNQHLKFGLMLAQARALGADFLATGHYARIQRDEKSRRYAVLKGADPRKDQSYFLYGLTQDQLSRAIFPLGTFRKDEIRKMVRDAGLEVADQPESQEICFIENNDYRSFLRKRAGYGIKPGPFLDQQGRVLGRHQGLPFYTIGQRKGLGLAFGQPMYVVRIDPERNAVVLGKESLLLGRLVWAENNNFYPFAKLDKPVAVTAKIRSAAEPAAAAIMPVPDQQVRVEFAVPQRALTPGQAIVYYQGELVVGGGTIVRAE